MDTFMLASLWPCLILISLYKQLAPHLKIGVHKSNTVRDFDTIWAIAAAIIIQQECIMWKERSRSVKRPRFNWIFFLPTRASRYTIFR